jgi:hypothetical protein
MWTKLTPRQAGLPLGADFSTKAYRDFYKGDAFLLWFRLLPFGVFIVSKD